jgi:hypothetical protein
MGASESISAAPPETAVNNDGFTPSWCAATSWHSHSPAGLMSSSSKSGRHRRHPGPGPPVKAASASATPIGWREARNAYEHDLVLWQSHKRRTQQRRAKILRLQHLQYSMFGRKPTFGSLYGPFFTPFPPIWEEPSTRNDNHTSATNNNNKHNNGNNSCYTTTTSQEYQRRLLAAVFPPDAHTYILDAWTSYTARFVSAINLVMSAITQGVGAGGGGSGGGEVLLKKGWYE